MTIIMMMMMMMMTQVPGTENNLQGLPLETMATMVFGDGWRWHWIGSDSLFLSSEGLHSKMFRNSANLGTRLTVACLFPGSATKVTQLSWLWHWIGCGSPVRLGGGGHPLLLRLHRALSGSEVMAWLSGTGAMGWHAAGCTPASPPRARQPQ